MSERVLYFDCFSGVAGDMTLGALLDLGIGGVEGLEVAALVEALGTLPLPSWHLETSACLKHGLRGLKAHLTIEGDWKATLEHQYAGDVVRVAVAIEKQEDGDLAVVVTVME